MCLGPSVQYVVYVWNMGYSVHGNHMFLKDMVYSLHVRDLMHSSYGNNMEASLSVKVMEKCTC